jgi:hypothetical protein
MPLMGVGPLSAGSAGLIVLTAVVLLVGHVVYGTLLGWLAGGFRERNRGVRETPRLAA